jgi:DNA topoisomerase II
MPPKQVYIHKSQKDQILLRPGQHIGSVKNELQLIYIADENCHIIQKEINYNCGLIHIFYEILSNAQDNYFKSLETEHPLKKIMVNIDPETGSISIWNDGLYIPTVIHKWHTGEEKIAEKIYEAELIFGHLNSSGNYNDSETARVGGGLHGHGAKLTNIFSKTFAVETFDPDTGLRFNQTFTNNMSEKTVPIIKQLKQKKGWTCITFTADFERFGITGYTNDHIGVMKKMCIDAAMITGQNVYFNNEKMPVKNLKIYSDCYVSNSESFVEFKTPECNVIIREKDANLDLHQISFVNGINTIDGGVHVDIWKEAVYKQLVEKIVKKLKIKTNFKNKNLDQYLIIFVKCNLENPHFKGQTKEKLVSPVPVIDASIVTQGKINNMLKWSFVETIQKGLVKHDLRDLAKQNGTKVQNVALGIEKADDAKLAGTKDSQKCTLYITEGLSAKTFVVAGLKNIKDGNKLTGILPVKGKILNVRDASPKQIAENKEITHLIKMLGLKYGTDYNDDKAYKSLRYGSIKILTDADVDGAHIKGLIINFFAHFFPSLLDREFITSIRTPIVKIKNGPTFYYEKDFHDWAEKNNNFKAKYYKGLGTSTNDDIETVFKDPFLVQYVNDSTAIEKVDMAFAKKRANDRKEWLKTFTGETIKYKKYKGIEQVPITSFINYEFIHFSIADCERSIPNLIDGLKLSQRKALHIGLSLKEEQKLESFAGRVSNETNYHHGVISMQSTIINMAQTFVASNNIPLFENIGQFGTRLEKGQDAASARYLTTRISKITQKIFRKEDLPILEYLIEENNKIEPKYFVPIIPMLLVNGVNGIGTGHSTDIPCFNPIDIVKWIKNWLKNKDANHENLIPWYRGFKGKIIQDENNPQKYYSRGIVTKVDDHYHVSEIPISISIEQFKENLVELSGLKQQEKGQKVDTYDAMTVADLREELKIIGTPATGTKQVLITKLKNAHKETGTPLPTKIIKGGNKLVEKFNFVMDTVKINFDIWTVDNAELGPQFKLQDTITMTNMVAFDGKCTLRKYENTVEILTEFCNVRYDFYVKRKKYLIKVYETEKLILESKAKFIKITIDKPNFLKQDEQDIFVYFENNNYYKKPIDNFKYLTDMPVRNFTADKYKALLAEIDKITEQIDYIKKKTPTQMWNDELDELFNILK